MLILLQCFVRWLLALGWLAVAIAVTLAFAFGNFLVTWQSFEAQGYEDIPMAEVPLLGPVTVALGVGGAPLAAAYALFLTAVMNALAITIAKIVVRLFEGFFDWRRARASDDAELRSQADTVRLKLIEQGGWLVVFAALAAPVIAWDVAQLSFRNLAIYTNLADPTEAIGWGTDLAALVGPYLHAFTRTAAWGYVGCVLGAAIMTEFAFSRAGEQWRTLDRVIEQFVQGPAGPRNASGDAIQAPALAGPNGAAATGTADHPAVSAAAVLPGATHTAANGDVRGGQRTDRPAGEPVAGPEPTRSAAPEPPRAGGPEVDVIVGPAEVRRLPLADVEARPDLYIRDMSGRHWFARPFYENDVMPSARPVEEPR
jgi:hypothetical protein